MRYLAIRVSLSNLFTIQASWMGSRQIMDILFARGEATVRQIQDLLDEPPTVMAVRRMLHILEEKGYLNRRQESRRVVYSPRESRTIAGSNALKHVLDTSPLLRCGCLDPLARLAGSFRQSFKPTDPSIRFCRRQRV